MELKYHKLSGEKLEKIIQIALILSLAVCVVEAAPDTLKSANLYDSHKITAKEELAIFEVFINPYLNRIYGAFYADLSRKHINFQKTKLHRILLERELELSAVKKGAQVITDKEQQIIQRIRNTVTDQIERDYGTEILSEFMRYENSMRLQQALNLINQSLLFQNQPLNVQQYEYMLHVLLKNVPTEKWMDFNEEQMMEYCSKRKGLHAKLLEEARAKLLPKQLAELELEFEIEEGQLPYYAMRNRQAKLMKMSKGMPNQ